ncbi:MAG: hypothetical protein KIS86_09290 [Devosia sp.]|nr:hypothetical protein [Devosia sp.]
MRFALTLFLALSLATPALAQGGGRYDNARFGYSIAVPEGFVAQGESANGDGQRFELPGRVTSLVVWGGHLDDFESEVAARIGYDTAENWSISYQATSPKWASWSGSKGGRILYQRMILLCEGTGYAAFRMEYGQVDRPKMDRVVERLVSSFSRC